MILRSVDCYDLFAPYFDFEGFFTLALKYKLSATKIWLRCSRENALDATYAPPYPQTANGRWDLQHWDSGFETRFVARLARLIEIGTVPLLVYVDGATWRETSWEQHPWNSANNFQRWGSPHLNTAREAGPSGKPDDDLYMHQLWYPLVDKVRSVLLPRYWDRLVHVPTSEPRVTFHPTRFMVRYLRNIGVPRERIMISGLNDRLGEWDALKGSDDLKRGVGIISIHGVRDLKQAREKLGDLPQRYSKIRFRPDSDGARVPKTNAYLSRAGLDGRMTGMKPAWWKPVVQAYPDAGLLLGLWGFEHPNISKLKAHEWAKYWQAADSLFRIATGDRDE